MPNKGKSPYTFLLLAGSIVLALISIAAAQILLAAALVSYIRDRRSDQTRSAWPSFTWPFLGLFVWTIVTALFSPHLLPSVIGLKKFYIFSIAFLVPIAARAPGARERIYVGVFVAAALASIAGIWEYVASPVRDLDHRIAGFSGHWMTFSGLLMLSLVALFAYLLVYGAEKGWWTIPIAIAAGVAIYISQTRSTLVAAAIGIAAIMLAAGKRRWVAALASLIVVLYLASPSEIKDRFRAGFDPNHRHTRPRIELLETSLRLIRAHPLMGVGLGGVSIEAPKFKGKDSRPEWTYFHMHNNMLQIAAERGIPGLLLWLWFMATLIVKAIREIRISQAAAVQNNERRMVALAALGGCAALLCAGMLEYNFGDSEILMLFLFIAGAPFAQPETEAVAAVRQGAHSSVGETEHAF